MRNLEIKCRYPNHRLAERLARDELGATFAGTLFQTDTYFPIHPGRFKLRHIREQPPDGRPVTESYELIHYHRPDRRAARTSDYRILPLADGPAALTFFTASLGVRVRVQKARKLYLGNHLRIHLDTVRGLGKFLEFELIVSRANPLRTCQRRMRELLALFRIARDDLIPASYSDLLLA